MNRNLYSGVLPALAFLWTSAAQGAGGHYIVDDAVILDKDTCHVEAWYGRGDSSNEEYVVFPACTPVNNLQLGLAGIRFQEDGRWDTAVEFEAKTLFREPRPGSYGVGLTVIKITGDTLTRYKGTEVLVPLTMNPVEDLLLHYNLGWAYDRDDRNAGLWGIAGDYGLNERFNLIAEVYGTHRGGTELQGGLRANIPVGHVDLSYGRGRADSRDDRWVIGGVWEF